MLLMLGITPQAPAFLAYSGQLVTPRFDPVLLHPEGVMKWTVIRVAVVTGFPQHEAVDQVGHLLVGIVTRP